MKRKIWNTKILYVAALFCMILSCSYLKGFAQESSAAVNSAGSGTVVLNGWVKKNGSKYYYVNGKKAKGWTKISGKYYYFGPKGKLWTNRIAGTSETGQYYVDSKGIRVTDRQVRLAVAFVLAHTKTSWSKSKKLKACYDYLWKVCKYERAYDTVSISKMPSYAGYMFTYSKGNCYRGAAAFAYVARVLGYDSRVGVGAVSSRSTGALSVHGWTEIKIDGTWYMSDISMQRPRPYTSLYMLKSTEYPFRLRRDDTYTLKVTNGKVKWK